MFLRRGKRYIESKDLKDDIPKDAPKNSDQPTLLKIIAKKNELDKKAYEYILAIEEWYRRDDSGCIVYSPMNVHGGHRGKSDRPSHNSAYELLLRIRQFAINDLRVGLIDQLVNFFILPISSIEEFLRISAKGETDIETISSKDKSKMGEHITMFREFSRCINELSSMIEAYKLDEQIVIDDLNELFKHYADDLMKKHGYDVELVCEVCDAIYLMVKKSENSFEIGLNEMAEIDGNFYTFFCISNPSNRDERREALLNFIKYMPHINLVEGFKNAFLECDYNKNLADVIRQAEPRWPAIALWKTEHHRKFKPILNEINNTTFDEFKKRK